MQHSQLSLIYWNTARLLQLGVNEEFIMSLSDKEIMELLKGVIYLLAKNRGLDALHPTST
jgi:hypothetical protein